MTDTRDEGLLQNGLPEESDHIGQLLRLAGPREAVPLERVLRVRAAVEAEWRRQTRVRSQRTTIGWSIAALATAALVLFGVRLAMNGGTATESPAAVVATVEILRGTVRQGPGLDAAATPPVSWRVGDAIRAGKALDTTMGGRAALRFTDGTSVRVDNGTRLQLVSETALVLERGAIYVDSGPGDSSPIEVRTRLGVARDIGTRFEVRLDTSALRVRVRDGLVQLTQSGDSHEAKSGDELTLDESGAVVRRTVPLHGADWEWAVGLANPFEVEGRSLKEFLDWIAGETGWRIRFADADLERKSATIVLHGSIEGFTPEEALSAMLPPSGVEHQLENGVLRIWLGAGDTTN